MRIECPSCSAAYNVADSLMSAGRVVRCARCGSEWMPVAAVAPEPGPPEPVEPAEPPPMPPSEIETPAPVMARPSAMDRLAAHAAWPQSSSHLRLAWVASIAVLVLGVGAAFAWRGQIVEAWPPSARAYALFGMQPQTQSQQ